MGRSVPASLPKRRALYLALLAVQAASAALLVIKLLPFFLRLLDSVGELQDFSEVNEAVAILCVIVFQTAYWWRVNHLAVPFETRSLLASHLFQFVARLSFIFASTFASIVFFRHMPQLSSDDFSPAGVLRFTLFLAMLFSWFCFALELEGLGKRQPRP